MVGAGVNEQGLVEDEQGNLWLFSGEVSAEGLLLLWIADNHTPNGPTDDEIVKVWREAYIM